MDNLKQIVAQVLKTKNWDYRPIEEDSNALELRFNGENGLWLCHFYIDESVQHLRFISYCPEVVPENKYIPMLQLLTRLNWELPMGCFAMNLETGEIFYRTALNLEGIPATEKAIWQMILVNVATMDQFLNIILELIQE